jgi:hypothetical protein
MGVSYVLGRITSPIFTAVIFFLVLTPIGLIRRLLGNDSLRLSRPDEMPSYFEEHPAIDDEDLERQF